MDSCDRFIVLPAVDLSLIHIFKGGGIVVCILGLYVVNSPEKKNKTAVLEGEETKSNAAGKKKSLLMWMPVLLMIVANLAYSITAKVTPCLLYTSSHPVGELTCRLDEPAL